MRLRVPGAAWLAVLCALLVGCLVATLPLARQAPAGSPAEAEVLRPDEAASSEGWAREAERLKAGPAAPLAPTAPTGVPHATPARSPAERATPAAPTPTVAAQVLGSVNYLLLGLDRRGDEVPRADVLIMGNVDLGSGRASVLSIPRDLMSPSLGTGATGSTRPSPTASWTDARAEERRSRGGWWSRTLACGSITTWWWTSGAFAALWTQ